MQSLIAPVALLAVSVKAGQSLFSCPLFPFEMRFFHVLTADYPGHQIFEQIQARVARNHEWQRGWPPTGSDTSRYLEEFEEHEHEPLTSLL